MSEIQATSDAKETGRTEAFSDGVFAIAITLLILEIRVPHPGETGESLATLLLQQWPSYMAYVLSFLVIAVMWVNHHNLFRYIQRVDNLFLFLNSLLLMVITFVNFSTALLADYLLDPAGQQAAGLVYAGTGIVVAILFNLMWRHAIQNSRLIDANADRRLIQAISDQYRYGPLLYGVAFALVFISIWLSLALQFGLAIFVSFTDSTKIRAKAGLS
jgi:uncharacterized membrane protein